MLWSLNPISGEWSEANLVFKVKTQTHKHTKEPNQKHKHTNEHNQTKNTKDPNQTHKHTNEQNQTKTHQGAKLKTHEHTKEQNHKILCLNLIKPKHSKHSSYTQPRLIHTYS